MRRRWGKPRAPAASAPLPAAGEDKEALDDSGVQNQLGRKMVGQKDEPEGLAWAGKATRRRKSFGKAVEFAESAGEGLALPRRRYSVAWLGLHGRRGLRWARTAHPRAVRRDGVLEPARRHQQGRQGARELQGAVGPVGIPDHGPRCHRRRNAGRPDTATLTVSKNFFVDLKVPASLTQGDKPRLVGKVHHTGVTGKLALRLTVYTGGREDVFPKTIELSKDGVDEVVFDPFEVPEAESVRLTLLGTIGGTMTRSRWKCRSVRGESRPLRRSRARAARARRCSSGYRLGGLTRTRRC